MPMNRSRRQSTESSEDYLEAILRIRSERGSCRNVDIACLLGYSKASVTKALAGLSAAGLAEVVARDVRLTPEGERIARRTLGRHRFFEGLLLEAGVDGKTASRDVPHGALPVGGLLREARRPAGREHHLTRPRPYQTKTGYVNKVVSLLLPWCVHAVQHVSTMAIRSKNILSAIAVRTAALALLLALSPTTPARRLEEAEH